MNVMNFAEALNHVTATPEPVLVIVRGTPGAGKSTLAKKLAISMPDRLPIILEADQFFIMPDGSYKFDPSKLGAAHKGCQERCRIALEDPGLRTVFVANTFTTRREFREYEDIAEALGVPMIVLKVDGGYKNVHGVPDTALNKMRDRWQDYPGEILVR